MNAFSHVHGNAVMPEQTAGITLPVHGISGTNVTGLAQGWGKTFRIASGRSGWFHFAIPLTVTKDPAAPDGYLPPSGVRSVSAYWISDIPPVGGPVGIDLIHVWDGKRRLKVQGVEGYIIAGDCSYGAPGWLPPTQIPKFGLRNTIDLGTSVILQEGLGLSLHVVAQGEGNITFHSAGCWLS